MSSGVCITVRMVRQSRPVTTVSTTANRADSHPALATQRRI